MKDTDAKVKLQQVPKGRSVKKDVPYMLMMWQKHCYKPNSS